MTAVDLGDDDQPHEPGQQVTQLLAEARVIRREADA